MQRKAKTLEVTNGLRAPMVRAKEAPLHITSPYEDAISTEERTSHARAIGA